MLPVSAAMYQSSEKVTREKSGAFSSALPHPSFDGSLEELLHGLQPINTRPASTLTGEHANPALSAEL